MNRTQSTLPPAMQHLLEALEARSRPLAELLRRTLERGETSTRYRIESELAHGGMGIVFRVTDLEVGRELALKRTREPLPLGPDPAKRVVDPRYFARFLAEVRITGQLDHPGVVPLHELGLDAAGRLFFTMKLVSGETLASVLTRLKRREPEWSLARICEILLRICDAVAFAHVRAIVHRDLKPANVMVGTFGEVYVMDWGLARELETVGADDVATSPHPSDDLDLDDPDDSSGARTMEGEAVGTPSYMPPEQALGKLAEIDGRVDVYAIGAILYHALTGEAPYASDVLRGATGSGVVLRNVARHAPTPIARFDPNAPPELIAICEKAMARDRRQRYPSVDALAVDLKAFLENRVVSAFAAGPGAELGKWIARHRSHAVIGFAVATIVTVAIGFGLRSMGSVQRALALRDKASGETIELLESRIRMLDDSSTALREQLTSSTTELAHERADKEALARDATTQTATLAERDEKIADLEAKMHALLERWSIESTLPETERPSADTDPSKPSVPATNEQPLLARIEQFQRARVDVETLVVRAASLRDVIATKPSQVESWLTDYAALAARVESLATPDPALESLHSELAALLERELGDARTRLEAMGEAQQRIATEVAAIPSSGPLSWSGIAERMAPRLGDNARRLTAEPDLVPLGFDSESGLPEFWLVESGRRPERDSRTGKLSIEPESGIVLVLIPGGKFKMGARREKKQGRGSENFDPRADENESEASGDVVTIDLDAFYLAKYELTNHQWRTLSRRVPPSRHPPGSVLAIGDKGATETITLRHPVEGMSWDAGNALLAEFGLVLPTEAQWEYAARGLASNKRREQVDGIPFWFASQDPTTLTRYANVLDGSRGALYWSVASEDAKLADAFALHAPVGSFEPNPLGLYDVIGNVSEWCQDVRAPLSEGARRGDGLLPRDRGSERARAIRGGDFRSPSHFARTTARRFLPRDEGFEFVGIRAARPIVR